MEAKRTLRTFLVGIGAMLVAATPSLAQSGELQTKHGFVTPIPALQSPLLEQPPVPPSDEAEGEIPPRMDPPVDPTVRLESIKPTSPETEAKIIPELLSGAIGSKPAEPLAPGTFRFFQNTILASAPVVGGVTLNAYSPIEPSGAANGRVIFFTTNSYAAVSGDRGQTFSYIDPFKNFTSVNSGFGGDQVIYYARQRGLTFWLLQYNPDNNTNTQRLAVARSQQDILQNNWITYDFTPANFGFTNPPPGASGFWLDFPDLATSDNFLYQTTNVFPRIPPNPLNQCASTCPIQACPAACGGNCTPNVCSSVGAVVMRLSLAELAAGGTVNYNYYNDTNFGYRCTQGAHDTMYWGSHNSNTQMRIYRWPENSTSITANNVNHSAYNVGTMNATSPDGTNFAAYSDSRILASWVANSVIGFMWNAAQGGSFTYPHVEVVRFNESDRSLVGQGQIFSSNIAWMYPSVHPDDRGDLGGTIAWGGGTFYPNAAAWIADDFNSGTITPLENLTFATGFAGPSNNRWGDYFSTRITPPYGNTWSGTGYVLSGAGGVTRQPNYIWFGRERDTPPATNTIFIGSGNTTGWEDGSFAHPYMTVTRGHFAAVPGDRLLIGSGNYLEHPTLTTPVSIDTLFGAVTIGR